MMRNIRQSLFVFLCFLTQFAFAQEDFFINKSRFMQKTNPSFFGFNSLNKVGVLYNTISVNTSDKQDNKYAFGALSFEGQNFSLGLDLNSFKFQSTGFNVNNGGLTFVYKVQLTNDIYFLPAIKLGYASSSVAVDNLIFEDQINAVTGFINTETIDPLAPQISSVNYLDLGTSFIIHNEVFIAGLSLRNLNQPNASFNKESAEKLPISIAVQGGYEFDLNAYRQGLLPEFSFLYLYGAVTKFGNSLLVSLSQEAQLGSFSLGISQQASKLNTFSLTSIGLSVGASVENFDFGLQYNIPIKQINQVFAPSVFELYVAFDFSIYRRNNRGRYKRLVTDNY